MDLKSPKNYPLKFDFAIFDNNNTLIKLIEYDGETHFPEYEGGWLTAEKIKYQQLCDELKNQYCQNHNIDLIRFNYKDKNKKIIEEKLLNFIKED